MTGAPLPAPDGTRTSGEQAAGTGSGPAGRHLPLFPDLSLDPLLSEFVGREGNRGTVPGYGGVIIGLRQQRGWTQEQLSAHSGVSVRTIRNIETGRVGNPRHSSVRMLFAVLDEESLYASGTGIRAAPDHPAAWRGPLPSHGPFPGRGQERAETLAALRDHRLVDWTGSDGVCSRVVGSG
ncbi:multiprotein-bridging factor 1 family protein [Streptomyces sp. NPDC058657]|uniref:helix-turn-helix domain-containing protein n=1 Tax=unclassified Streptomyces TaxID=2593676 RepID=UPI0036643D15